MQTTPGLRSAHLPWLATAAIFASIDVLRELSSGDSARYLADERWSALRPFGPADQVVARWAWENIPRVRRLFDELEAHPPPGTVVIRLRGWRQIDAFLRSMQKAGPA